MTSATAVEQAASQTNATDERAEQLELLRNSAIDFVAGSTDHKRLRERRETLPGYDTAIVRQMADLGWLGILVPEDQGGLGLGFSEMAVVLQELGKGLLAEPLVATVVLAGQVLRHGENDALRQRLLPGIADGSLTPCLAWQEDAGGLQPMPSQTHAEMTGGRVRISGRKRFVAGAGAADGFLVTARSGEQAGVYWVPRDATGVEVRHEWRADGTPSTVVTFDGVTVADDDVLSAPSAQALVGVERAVEQACVMVGAEMLGVIETTLKMTIEYMRNRVQFGKPIGSFQALQHKAVDLYIQQELVRAVLGDAVQALDGGGDALDVSKIASRCKSRCSEAGLRVTRESIQLHGAIGFTDEYDVGLYLKRALVLSAWLGNSEAHRRRFAALNAPAWRG